MKPKLVLIGGGGHCAACIDVIEQEDRFKIAGIVEREGIGNELLGYPILGNDEELPVIRATCDYALITVGQIKTPAIRIRLFEHAKSLGFTLATIVSPRAYVSKHASLGEGTIVMHDALINACAIIGNNCIINTKALVEHDAIVEEHSHISTGAIVNGGAKIRKGTFVGSNSVTREGVATQECDFIKAGSLFRGNAHV